MAEVRVATAMPAQNLFQDEAYRLTSRGVIGISAAGDLDAIVAVLQPLVCSDLSGIDKRPRFTNLMDKHGVIRADLFVWCHEGGLLIDCAMDLIRRTINELSASAVDSLVQISDVSSDWRVLAELPDQSTFDDGTLCLRCKDPRWHMGARVLRPVHLPESYSWGAELKWVGHAYKLGFLPGAEVLLDGETTIELTVAEVGLHAMNLVDTERLPLELQHILEDPKARLQRRLLPLRVEPNAFTFPGMRGAPITAGGTTVGTVVAHHSLYGLALVDLTPWRVAQAAGETLLCEGQPVLLSWPSWLAQESYGRGGPVARADQP